MEIVGRWYETGTVVRIRTEGEKVAESIESDAGIDRSAMPWIAPGLIDLQINGYGGQEFSSDSLTVDGVQTIVDAIDAMGVAKFLPTITTQSIPTLTRAMQVINQACQADRKLESRIPAVHLEGPYISLQDGPRGAHPKAHCRMPDWNEFRRLQDAAAGRIRLVTLSPEFDESFDFITQAADAGLIVSLGHTAATPDQIRRAADAGASMSTHLGNGSHPVLPRHDNYLWAQLAEDRLTAGIIADDHHLPASVLKTIIRAKQPRRCVLVSDLSGYAGLPPGRYDTELCELELLPSGKLVMAGQRELLAGASQPLIDGIGNAMSVAELDLAAAVQMASTRPAEIIGAKTGGLATGEPADFITFDLTRNEREGAARLELRETFVAGECVWSREPA